MLETDNDNDDDVDALDHISFGDLNSWQRKTRETGRR